MTTLTQGTTTSRWLSSFCFALGIRPGTVFVAVRDTLFTPDTITAPLGVPVRWTTMSSYLL